MEEGLSIEYISNKDDLPFDLLLRADPSKEYVKDYVRQGKNYVIKKHEDVLGVLVVLPLDSNHLEIKNISIDPFYQRQGLASDLLKFAELEGKKGGYKYLQVATGNSSIGPLQLYQNCGFEIKETVYNFFIDHYPDPIFENGIQCKDQIILKKAIH